MSQMQKAAAARTFVRSLNLLLKSARLYGLDHTRCEDQFRAVWSDLQVLLGADAQGCLLGLAGRQLLADGAPVEIGPSEKSFVDALAAAGLASIQFTKQTSEDELRRFARGFAAVGPKAEAAAEQLKQALAGGDGSIRLNAVRYVTEDAAIGDASIAARLTAKSLSGGPVELRDVLENPQQLLQLIAAAQGVGGGARPVTPGAEAAAPATGAPAAPPTENDSLNLLRTIADIARAGRTAPGEPSAPLPQKLSELPASSQELFQQALAGLAAMAPKEKPDAPMLVQLAEHLAIRFALERFERGEVRVNSIRETLERASREIAELRKILTGHETALTKAGVAVESHADVLDRQFWAAVPEGGKRAALLSPEVWCIPPRNVRQFTEELFSRGEKDAAAAILLNYSSCVGSAEPEARQRAATGVAELAGLCARADSPVLESAIRCVGEQITWESDPDIQELLAKAYARLTQEAVSHKNHASIQTSLSWLEHAAHEKPEMARDLLPRLGVEDRLPDFIEDAIREKEVPVALTALFQRSARPVANLLAARFSRCSRREECQRVIEVFGSTGGEAVTHLREVLRSGAPAEAAATVGLLSRFGPDQVERLLLSRLPSWGRAQHDVVVRQLALGGAPERGRLLARLFSIIDRMVLSEALDEISLSGDPSTGALLKKLAAGEVAQAADPFMRVKAVEGLGRLRDTRAAPLLRELATAKQMWSWAQPEEMRVVTVQALSKIDPDWTRAFVPQSGLNLQDLALAPLEASAEAPWARQRRYTRVSLPRTLNVLATTPKGNLQFETNLLSLGGGMASSAASVAPGMSGSVQIKSGWRTLSADVLFREGPRQQTAFEIVAIGLEDRARIRRLLSAVTAA